MVDVTHSIQEPWRSGASPKVVGKPRLLFSPVSQRKPCDIVCNASFKLVTRRAMAIIELCLISHTQRQKRAAIIHALAQ
jgi:hypothetical protein